MKLLIAGHTLSAIALIFASVMTVKLVGVASLWVGVLLGLVLYALTIWIAKAEAGEN